MQQKIKPILEMILHYTRALPECSAYCTAA